MDQQENPGSPSVMDLPEDHEASVPVVDPPLWHPLTYPCGWSDARSRWTDFEVKRCRNLTRAGKADRPILGI